jgi:hypothetical protein
MEGADWNLLALLFAASGDYYSDVGLRDLRASVVSHWHSTDMFATETRSARRLYGES